LGGPSARRFRFRGPSACFFFLLGPPARLFLFGRAAAGFLFLGKTPFLGQTGLFRQPGFLGKARFFGKTGRLSGVIAGGASHQYSKNQEQNNGNPDNDQSEFSFFQNPTSRFPVVISQLNRFSTAVHIPVPNPFLSKGPLLKN
jgi:hypothetical protein